MIVIVGASSGIGKELAHLYCLKGHNLLLLSRNDELLSALTIQLQSITIHSNQSIQYCILDITNNYSIIHKTLSKYPSPNLLILNAGILDSNQFNQNSDIYSIFNTNVFGLINITKYYLSYLTNNDQICVISSLGGVIPAPTRALYCSTKFALNGFFQSLRQEVCFPITIICPSRIDTELRQKSGNLEKGGMKPEICALEIQKAIERKEKLVFLPRYNYFIYLLYIFFPSLIEYFAKKKYQKVKSI